MNGHPDFSNPWRPLREVRGQVLKIPHQIPANFPLPSQKVVHKIISCNAYCSSLSDTRKEKPWLQACTCAGSTRLHGVQTLHQNRTSDFRDEMEVAYQYQPNVAACFTWSSAWILSVDFRVDFLSPPDYFRPLFVFGQIHRVPKSVPKSLGKNKPKNPPQNPSQNSSVFAEKWAANIRHLM